VNRREENACAARLAPDTMIDAVGFCPEIVAGMKLRVIDDQLAVKQVQLFNVVMAVGAGSRPPGASRTIMLTRFFSVSVASTLQEMPGATSFHSGSAHRGGTTGTTGAPPVSAAIRCPRRPQSDADGRSTSIVPGDKGVDDRAKRFHLLPAIRTRGDLCASTPRTSLEGRACRAYCETPGSE